MSKSILYRGALPDDPALAVSFLASIVAVRDAQARKLFSSNPSCSGRASHNAWRMCTARESRKKRGACLEWGRQSKGTSVQATGTLGSQGPLWRFPNSSWPSSIMPKRTNSHSSGVRWTWRIEATRASSCHPTHDVHLVPLLAHQLWRTSEMILHQSRSHLFTTLDMDRDAGARLELMAISCQRA
jgi:hypothetical protein